QDGAAVLRLADLQVRRVLAGLQRVALRVDDEEARALAAHLAADDEVHVELELVALQRSAVHVRHAPYLVADDARGVVERGRLGYELRFEVPRPMPMQLMLYVHPEQAARLRHPERIEFEPATAVEDFIDAFGNRAARILAPAGPVRIRYDNVIRDSGRVEAPI